jgi:two-component system, sensor histidine kinase and response regulator
MDTDKNWTALYPLNVRTAREVVDGDEEILEELFQIFIEHLPEQLEKIRTAVWKDDGGTVQFYAHQIKGAMRNFAAEEACTRAYALEKAGKEDNLAGSRVLFRNLTEEIEVLKKYIDKKGWKKYF